MINEQRVRRIKNTIYFLIVVMFFLPFVIMIVMGVRLISRMDSLITRLDGVQVPAAEQSEYLPESGGSSGPRDADFEADAPTPPADGNSGDAAGSEEDAVPGSSGEQSPETGDDVPEQTSYGKNSYIPATYGDLYFDTLPSPAQQIPNTLYLSFDNTPNLHTEEILSVLDSHGVKATFFVWGTGADDFYSRIVGGGHAIGIHSNANDVTYSELYSSTDAFFSDFSAIFQRIEQVTGLRTRLYRLPGGSIHPNHPERQAVLNEVKAELDRRGFIQHDWNASGQDAVNPALSKEQILTNLRRSLEDGSHMIVLLHDGSGASMVQALDEFIGECLAQGYEFRALNDDTVPVSFLDI